ncbi:MAG: calcium/sodium antiporter [Muribaculum sp.]|nr:calcium/sodium antiporter [Muribaculum sp.]
MWLNIILLIVGLALILVGANWLTDGSSAVAKKWGVSDLVIGLTVVAFGTSAPELVISIVSAIHGSAGLAVGNVVGSNIFNILVIIGCVAAISPVKVDKGNMTNDIPLVILSSLALLFCSNTMLLDGTEENVIERSEGLLLLLFFLIFMRYTFSIARSSDSAEGDSGDEAKAQPMPIWKSVFFIVAGLAGLIFGGEWFVDGASGVARGLNVSESIIGLTIVAAGTSLPELATSIVAATKGKTELAVGNVVGSCVFNVFLVLGAAATIRPLPLGGIGNFDLLTLVGASLLFWFFGWQIKSRTITRLEGVLLLAVYVGYTAILISKA